MFHIFTIIHQIYVSYIYIHVRSFNPKVRRKTTDASYKTNITSAHEWAQMTVTASSRRQNDASKTFLLCNHSWSLVIGFRLYPGQRVRLTVSSRTFYFFLRSRLQKDGKIMQIRKVNEEGHRSLDSSHATELRRRKRHRRLHRWLHQWLHDNNLAVGRTYVTSTFKINYCWNQKWSCHCLFCHPVAARSWYLERVTVLSRKWALLWVNHPQELSQKFPIEVQTSPKLVMIVRKFFKPDLRVKFFKSCLHFEVKFSLLTIGFFAAVSRGTTHEFVVILNEGKLIVDLLHRKKKQLTASERLNFSQL